MTANFGLWFIPPKQYTRKKNSFPKTANFGLQFTPSLPDDNTSKPHGFDQNFLHPEIGLSLCRGSSLRKTNKLVLQMSKHNGILLDFLAYSSKVMISCNSKVHFPADTKGFQVKQVTESICQTINVTGLKENISAFVPGFKCP